MSDQNNLSAEKNIDRASWREGSISLEIFNGTAKVFVERSGRMVPVIVTFHCPGGVTSHCVRPLGINEAIQEYAEEGP